MSYGVGRRCGSDTELLWLWRRPGAADPIRPLAWELPYAAGASLEKKNKKQKNKKQTKKTFTSTKMGNWIVKRLISRKTKDFSLL